MSARENVWIPAERFIQVIDQHPEPNQAAGIVGIRRIYDMRNGRQTYIGLQAADEMLTRMHLHYWFFVPKEKGGLADIYVDGKQYGRPKWESREPRTYDHEARLAARREAYARRKQAA